MGMFNVLVAQVSCPRCGHTGERRIQFRHGKRELREYRLGEPLDWYDPTCPSALPPDVRAWCPGYGDACPGCGYDTPLGGFAVVFDRGVIAEVVTAPPGRMYPDLDDAEELPPRGLPASIESDE